MEFNEALESLKGNPELAKSLSEALHRKADPAEIRDILVDAGMDSGSAETLIAAYQRKRGMAIADDNLDEEMLKQVAGGGCGKCTEAADCDNAFKDPAYWGLERCTLFEHCDEMN